MLAKRSRRLTRRSYRRKLIMFGISIFACLSLTATGFAAWVLSSNQQKTTQGSVEVGAIVESGVTMSDITFVDDVNTFSFEPAEADVTGRVRNDKENFENMSVSLQWTLSNYQVVGKQYVDFQIPETVHNAITEGYLTIPTGEGEYELLTGEGHPVEKDGVNYYTYRITLPEVTENKTGDLISYTVTSRDGEGKASDVAFTLTLKFGWGTKFNLQNPGDYYDTDEVGKTVDYPQLKKDLITFGATLHGYTYEELETLDEAALAQKYADKPLTYYAVVNVEIK